MNSFETNVLSEDVRTIRVWHSLGISETHISSRISLSFNVFFPLFLIFMFDIDRVRIDNLLRTSEIIGKKMRLKDLN